MSCPHPFPSLEVDPGGAGRGQVGIQQVRCKRCDARFAGPLGIKCLVESLKQEQAALWAALRSIGLPADQDPSSFLEEGRYRGPGCSHPLGWLRVEGAGNARGHSGSIWFKCSGCKEGWPLAAGLKLFLNLLKNDTDQIKAAIRRLGGQVS